MVNKTIIMYLQSKYLYIIMGSSVADLGGACGARPIESQEGLLGRPRFKHTLYI